MTPARIVPAYLLASEPAEPAARLEDIEVGKPPQPAEPADIEVGNLLEELEQPIGRLVEENHRLRATLVAVCAELDRLRQLASAPDGVAAAPVRPATSPPAAPIPPATDAAATPVRHASGAEPPVVMMARQTAESYLDDARRAAGRLISEARQGADQIIRDAQADAEAVEQSARHWHNQTVVSLESHRAALERDLARLREVEQECRMRIRADLQDRLHELEDPDPERDNRYAY